MVIVVLCLVRHEYTQEIGSRSQPMKLINQNDS